MFEKHFTFQDYWSLYKLSCKSYIYHPSLVRRVRLIIAAYILFGFIFQTVVSILYYFSIPRALLYAISSSVAFFIIINPYYFKYALHYKTSDWYINTGYLPSEVCSDIGIWGEYHATIDVSSFKGKYGKIYNNLIIPKPDGSFTELDLVIVSEYMTAVLEVKARGGTFSGHILDNTWIQRIGSQTNELQNPVIQNQNHINFLSLYLENTNHGHSTKLSKFPEFDNIIYFALPIATHIDGKSPFVTIGTIHTRPEILHNVKPIFTPDEVKALIERLDKIPKFTTEEKSKMYAQREVQYRNGEFLHRIVYYPVLYINNTSEICMDAGTYQFYQKEDGLWRTNVSNPLLLPIDKGTPCETVQAAVLQRKELKW